MKLVFENSVSIMIREEDFTEITVGLEEISYMRPNGTKAVIKFSQTILPLRSKKEEIKVAAESPITKPAV